MTCLSDGLWSGNTTTFCKGWFIFEKEAIFFFFSARITLDRMGEEFQFYLPRYSTMGPHKQRICLFVRNIKKCMRELYRKLISRNV